MSLELGTICLEILIVLISLLAIFHGNKFMFGFLTTFGIYLFIGLTEYYGWHFAFIDSNKPLLIFIATITATLSVWEICRD